MILIIVGPGSWLSICSTPGVQWVSAKTGTTRFYDVAQGLVIGWTKKLTMAPDTTRERCPEPEVENAWKYVTGTRPPAINHLGISCIPI